MHLSEICNSLVNTSLKINTDSLGLLKKFNEGNFERYKAVLEKRDTTLPFNLFQLLSHKSYHENFHSRIFQFLLEEEKCLHSFLEHLGIEKDNFIFPKVVCEEKRIDILIKGKDKEENKHAIIIENKMNNAVDQEEQLARYYNELTKDGYIVDKIVYLVPDKSKKPSEQTFSGLEDVKNKLQIIVGYDTSSNDLVTCLENIKPDEENYNFLLKHYIALLKQTGAGSMTYVAQKFLEELYDLSEKDSEAIEKIKYINAMTSDENFLSLRLSHLTSLISEIDAAIEPEIDSNCAVDLWFQSRSSEEWCVSLLLEDKSALDELKLVITLRPQEKVKEKEKEKNLRYENLFTLYKDYFKGKDYKVLTDFEDWCIPSEGFLSWHVKSFMPFSEDKLAAQEAVELYYKLKQYVEEWKSFI